MTPSRRKNQSGSTLIEFGLVAIVAAPLMMWVLWAGVNMGRGVEITQITRDAGHMYARKVDFTVSSNKDLVARLAISFQMTRTGGSAVVILSQLRKIYSADCAPVGLAACTNNGSTVFVNRVTIGNNSLRASNFGTPPTDATTGDVPNYLTDSRAVATGFDALINLKQSEIAYMAEGYQTSADIGFLSNSSGVYARSIF